MAINPDALKVVANKAIDDLLNWHQLGDKNFKESDALSAKITTLSRYVIGTILAGTAIASAITFTAAPILIGSAVSIIAIVVMYFVHEFKTEGHKSRSFIKGVLQTVKDKVYTSKVIVVLKIEPDPRVSTIRKLLNILTSNEEVNNILIKEVCFRMFDNMPTDQIVKALKINMVVLNLLTAIKLIKDNKAINDDVKERLKSVEENVDALDQEGDAKILCNDIVRYLNKKPDISKIANHEFNIDIFDKLFGDSITAYHADLRNANTGLGQQA